MIYDSIPLTEYTAVMDSRLHRNISQEIADPVYRQRIYTIDGVNGEPDGSDMRVLCMACINRSNGDAKLRGVILVKNDPVCDVLAIAALQTLFSKEFPSYQCANMVIMYYVDGSEVGATLHDTLVGISNRLGSKIDALKNSTLALF